jgi:hypothetical protein
MKLAAILLAAVLLAPASPARAEDRPAKPAVGGFAGFLKNLKEKLEKSAVAGERKKGRAVAAVRGAGQKSELAYPNEPSLKGDMRSRKLKQQMAEDEELLKATQLAEQGKHADALAAFQAFQKAHPKSHKEEVAQAIDELSKLSGGADALATASDEKPKN